MKDPATKGELETAIRHAIVKFEQEVMGRGPEDVRTPVAHFDLILPDMTSIVPPYLFWGVRHGAIDCGQEQV